jgi:shikimate kinase
MKKKAEVEDKDDRATFKSGVTGKRPEARKGPANVFLAGLPGSGKRELAESAAEKLGLRYVDLTEAFAEGGSEAMDKAAADAAAQGGTMAALPAKALGSQDLRRTVADNGVLVYLMADMPLLLARMGEDPERAAREDAGSEDELRAQFAEYEPLALGMASAILRAETEPEERVNDLVDKLQVMGGELSYDVNIKEVNW